MYPRQMMAVNNQFLYPSPNQSPPSHSVLLGLFSSFKDTIGSNFTLVFPIQKVLGYDDVTIVSTPVSVPGAFFPQIHLWPAFHLIQCHFAPTSFFERGLSGSCHLKQQFLHCSLPPYSSLFLFSILFFNHIKYYIPHLIVCFSPLKLKLHGAKTVYFVSAIYIK